MIRSCPQCGEEVKRKGTAKFCSKQCQQRSHYEKWIKESYGGLEAPPIPRASIGTIAELLVSADLLKRGMEVFRSLSPSSDADLVAVIGHQLLKVQVTSGCRLKDNRLLYNKHDKNNYDLIAVVERDSKITYFTRAQIVVEEPGVLLW